MKRSMNIIFGGYVALTLISCSDGSLDQLQSQGVVANQPLNDSTTTLNDGLKGFIWSARNGTVFDIERGTTTDLSNDGKVYPARDGSEYIQHQPEKYSIKESDPCNGFIYYTDIDVFNIKDTLTGELKTSFETKDRITGDIKMSPDGQTMITWAFNRFDCENEYDVFPTLLNREGEVVSRGNLTLISFDWLPDNRLVAFKSLGGGRYRLIVEVERNTWRFRTIKTIDQNDITGSPSRLRVSMDGKSALFEGYLGSNQFLSGVKYRNSTAYKIDLDGTNLMQIADSSRGGDKRVNQPIWSPDGSQILVTENFTSGSVATFYGSEEITTVITGVSVVPVSRNSATYAISADFGTTAFLPPDVYSDSVRPIFESSGGQLSAKFFNPLSYLRWTKTTRE